MVASFPLAPEPEGEAEGQLQVVFRGVGEENVHIIRLDRANPEEAKDLHIQASADGGREGVARHLVGRQKTGRSGRALPSTRESHRNVDKRTHTRISVVCEMGSEQKPEIVPLSRCARHCSRVPKLTKVHFQPEETIEIASDG